MFIAWWNPFAAIGEAILNFFIGVLLFLDSIVYSLISWVYQIILVLCQVDVLNNSFEIDALINRVYAIIGVVVLFLLAYSLLKSMVNPDDALKGKKSPVTIIKDVIISIVLIALIPTIFDFAMNFQTSILQNNTLGKIILGSTTVTERDENGNVVTEENSTDVIRNGGTTIASNVLRAFLHPNYSNCTVDETSDTGYDCSNIMIEQSAYGVRGSVTFDDFWRNTVEAGSIGAITDLSNNIVDGGVTYYYIISTVAGVFVLFVLLSYCFDIALRLIKLAVYQLIAPLPILARIMPGEQGGKVFSNWIKATISTYVEVFIRLAILFFAILIIKIVVQNFPSVFNGIFGGSEGFTVRLFAQLFIIIGIILFIKQAPGMIKDITGLDGGKFGKSFIRGIGMLGATFGGGATAAIRSVVNDTDKPIAQRLGRGALAALSGGARGLRQGAKTEKLGDVPKAAGTAASNTLSSRARREAAGGWGNYLSQWVDNKKSDAIGWASGSFEAQQKMLEQVNEFVKDAKAVKSTSEGFIRDKKYLFKYGANEEFGEKEIEVDSGRKDEKGNAIMEKKIVPRARITQDTTLSELDAMIQTLKSSGDVEDAKVAAALESKMNQKIKAIGKQLTAVSVDRSKAAEFDAQFSSAASKGIVSEAMVALDQTKSAYEIVQKKFAANQALEGVQNFKNDEVDGGNLTTDNVSKLADYLESQSSKIQENIKMEQERRKTASPKGGKDK
mgnify:CR=1 FL=1